MGGWGKEWGWWWWVRGAAAGAAHGAACVRSRSVQEMSFGRTAWAAQHPMDGGGGGRGGGQQPGCSIDMCQPQEFRLQGHSARKRASSRQAPKRTNPLSTTHGQPLPPHPPRALMMLWHGLSLSLTHALTHMCHTCVCACAPTDTQGQRGQGGAAAGRRQGVAAELCAGDEPRGTEAGGRRGSGTHGRRRRWRLRGRGFGGGAVRGRRQQPQQVGHMGWAGVLSRW